jgi:hypothetical protein
MSLSASSLTGFDLAARASPYERGEVLDHRATVFEPPVADLPGLCTAKLVSQVVIAQVLDGDRTRR